MRATAAWWLEERVVLAFRLSSRCTGVHDALKHECIMGSATLLQLCVLFLRLELCECLVQLVVVQCGRIWAIAAERRVRTAIDLGVPRAEKAANMRVVHGDTFLDNRQVRMKVLEPVDPALNAVRSQFSVWTHCPACLGIIVSGPRMGMMRARTITVANGICAGRVCLS